MRPAARLLSLAGHEEKARRASTLEVGPRATTHEAPVSVTLARLEGTPSASMPGDRAAGRTRGGRGAPGQR